MDIDDPLASTSFLDLISSALVAVVVLVVFAGADDVANDTGSSILSVYQADADHYNHLVYVKVGSFRWRASEDSPSDFSMLVDGSMDSESGCVISQKTTHEGSPPLTSVEFDPDETREFADRTMKEYGLTVNAVKNDYVPASVTFEAHGDQIDRPVELTLVYSHCTANVPHVIGSMSRSSSNDHELLDFRTFSKNARSDVQNLYGAGGKVLCFDGMAYLQLTTWIGPDSLSRLRTAK